MHGLDGDLRDVAVASTDDDIAVLEEPEAVDAEGEELLHWGEALIDGAVQLDFKEVAGFGAGVAEEVVLVDGDAGEDALDVAEVDIDGLDLGFWRQLPSCYACRW